MLKNNKKKFNNLGFYIEYTLIDPSVTYESINESSFIVRNIDKTSSGNNIFEWKNIMDNKIKNLLYIYVNLLSVPLYPWIDKTEYNLFTSDFTSYLLLNNQIDTYYSYININYQVAYIDNNIIDFISDNINYSYEINTNTYFSYIKSTRKITDEPYLYLNIDANNHLSNNTFYNTSKLTNNFNFKLVPMLSTNNFVYYKALKQYILQKLNNMQTINKLEICLFDSKNKKLINNHINNQINIKSYSICNCIDNIIKASCYCKYIRHPLNMNSQIDISFKIGQIQNELINNVFH